MVRTFKLKAQRPASRIDFEGDLNEQQLAVASAPGGPMLVIAGAGSGKTRSLVYRLAWLMSRGVTPSNLLLMTFTNRAAREMVQRVELLVEQDAHRIWAGTFHHVANRILRKHAERVGISPQFTIVDREDAADLVSSCIAEAGIPIERKRFPSKAVLLAVASFVANNRMPVDVVLAERYPQFASQAEAVSRVLKLYKVGKRDRGLLDYDDLLLYWLELLEKHEPVRAMLALQFRHILVDEYQDTNALQGRIVDLLAQEHRNVCVVGDDSQSIYSFRGADFSNIMGFTRRYPDAREYRLEINYRSTPQILDLANASIAHNEQRLPKTLTPVRGDGLRPALVPTADHFVQARFIAEYILHLHEQGRPLLDMAVLYRSHWHAVELQMELQRRNIPFTIQGGLRFYEQAHIKDVLSFLRIRHNGHDELAWQRALCLLPRIGGSMARQIWQSIEEADDPLAAALTIADRVELPRGAEDGYASFGRLLRRMTELQSPTQMIEVILAGHYGDYLMSHYDNSDLRRQDIDGVADFAGQYKTVEAFLSDVALTGDFKGETCVEGPDDQDFVTLSTVHQAKGLEWAVVLIPWVTDGRFPTDLAINTNDELEEERRVFHVAITRARDELYLVVPQIFSNHRKKRTIMKPSRFLTELENQNDLLETLVLEDDLAHVTSGAEPEPASGSEMGSGAMIPASSPASSPRSSPPSSPESSAPRDSESDTPPGGPARFMVEMKEPGETSDAPTAGDGLFTPDG